MPKVGNRNFPRTRAGQQQARRYAKSSGQPMRGTGDRAPYPTRSRQNNFISRPGRQNNFIRRPGPGMPPPPGGMRGAMNPGRIKPPVGPGTGIGGGPMSLPRRGNAIQNPAARLQGPGGRGGSRVMRNPGLGGRKMGGGNVPVPGFQNRRAKRGSGY